MSKPLLSACHGVTCLPCSAAVGPGTAVSKPGGPLIHNGGSCAFDSPCALTAAQPWPAGKLQVRSAHSTAQDGCGAQRLSQLGQTHMHAHARCIVRSGTSMPACMHGVVRPPAVMARHGMSCHGMARHGMAPLNTRVGAGAAARRQACYGVEMGLYHSTATAQQKEPMPYALRRLCRAA